MSSLGGRSGYRKRSGLKQTTLSSQRKPLPDQTSALRFGISGADLRGEHV
jgi:hypothetical protein